MTVFALGILIFVLIIVGIWEYQLHQAALSKLPNRIHVNGSRGKSSVVRLIAAGLRAGGFRTLAKVTGTSPRVIDVDGKDRIIHRLRSPSIGEQLRLLRNFSRQNPDYVVIECMAVLPDYQWVSEHKILQSNYGVLTNVRADHLEEMGYSLNHIAKSLSNTVPYNQKFFTSEDENYQILEDKAIKNNSTFFLSSGDQLDKKYLEGFPFIEHPDNIALALDICKDLGVENDQAIKGMRKMIPDPGALTITKLSINNSSVNFVNAFAVAEERGISVEHSYSSKETTYTNLIQTFVESDAGEIKIGGSAFSNEHLRIVNLMGYEVDFKPSGHMLFLKNNDVPGVIGKVGTMLGDQNVNIAEYHLSRSKGSEFAYAIIKLDEKPKKAVLKSLNVLMK